MRAVIQRVGHASVTINGTKKSEIGKGFLVLLGIENPDTEEDIAWLVKKIGGLRVFDDENGVMNLSVKDINGEILIVHAHGIIQERQPTIVHPCGKPRHSNSAIRKVLSGNGKRVRKSGENRNFRCRHEG